jgi:hypothetical protein
MPRKPIVWTLVIMLLVTGCNPVNPFLYGNVGIVEYKGGESPETTTTPYKATYTLYQGSYRVPHREDGTSDSVPPLETMPGEHFVRADGELFVGVLSCADKIGFEKSADGKIVAVAGSERIPVDDKDYCWYSTSEPEFEGLQWLCHETCKNGFTYAPLLLWPVALPIEVPIYAVVGVVLGGYLLYQFSHDACFGEEPQGHLPLPDSPAEKEKDGK